MMRRFILAALAALGLMGGQPAAAQYLVVAACPNVAAIYATGQSNRVATVDIYGTVCTAGAGVTFPTIGAAVPATGVYNALNVAGTLRGWSGLSTGAIFPGAVAIVDASGVQVTSFGGAATSSNASSAVATSSTNQAAVVWNYGFNGATWDQLQVDASKNLKVTLGTSGNNVGGYSFQLSPTITVDAGAYAAGDSMGGLVTVTGAARSNGGTGAVNGIRLKSNGGSTNTVWIYAWSKTPVATCTNNNAYVGSITDNAFAIVGFPTSVVLGGAPGAWDTSTYAQLSSMIANFDNQDTSPGTAIYLCLVTAGAVTPAATTDMSIIVSGMQD